MKEFPCDGPINVIIRTSAGEVDLIAEERTTATVDVTPGSTSEASRSSVAQTVVEMRGDLLMIETPPQHGLLIRRSGQVSIRVRVPSNSRLQFSSASADLRCSGVIRELEASSASGDVRVDHVAGDMQRKAASGDTQFNRVDGDASLNSASGDVRGGSVGGGLTARAASGDIRIDAVAGSVKAQTASGDMELSSLGSGMAQLTSASGDVQIGVAEGVSVWLDLSSLSGDTRSELPVSDSAPTGGVAALNLHVKTVSGDITVRRAVRDVTAPQEPTVA